MWANRSLSVAVFPKPRDSASTSRKSRQNRFCCLPIGNNSLLMVGSNRRYAFIIAATSVTEKNPGSRPKCTWSPVDSFVAARKGGERRACMTSQKRVTSKSWKRIICETNSTGNGFSPRGKIDTSSFAVHTRPQSSSSMETRRLRALSEPSTLPSCFPIDSATMAKMSSARSTGTSRSWQRAPRLGMKHSISMPTDNSFECECQRRSATCAGFTTGRAVSVAILSTSDSHTLVQGTLGSLGTLRKM
mmetsp:Transcript_132303/g.254777  ORF Transcript_132303/g.254777 Transcript_132303/m.254777 type:complete len:246 (+) Transcript_132303:536-1273(+)